MSISGSELVGASGGDIQKIQLHERFAGNTKASKLEINKVIAWTNQNFQAMKMGRTHTERQWYLNLSFYFGKQHVAFQPGSNLSVGTGGNLYVPPAPYWRSRPVINRIRPIIRTELSKLTSQKPSAYVVPASSDDHDLLAAQAGEQIWDSTYRRKKLRAIIRNAVWWQIICGTSFIKCHWDPDLFDVASEAQGDFNYMHETPFHVFVPDLREQELENQPYLIHAQLRSEDWCTVNFPGLNIQSGHGTDDQILNSSWLNIIGANKVQGQKDVLCLEVWIKPGSTPLFPEGGMVTVIGDQVVQSIDGWPYQSGMYPFSKLDHIPSGKFYADSTIVDLIPLQKEYNRTRGQIIEAKNKMAKPQLLAEKGSIVPAKITTEPGLVIEYETGFDPPQPLPLIALPQYVLQEQDRILGDMNDISGQHDITQGQVPPGVTAATAINYLQEQDESKLSVSFESIEEGVEKIAFLTLSYAQEFWDTPRLIKVIGTDGAFDATSFKGSDLRGNTDIRVEAGSALPTSKAAKQALIMDLMKMGFIPPETGLEVMEIGGIQKIYENMRVDVRQAQRENLRLAAVTPEISMQHEQEQIALVTGQDPNAMPMGPEGMDPNDPMAMLMGQMQGPPPPLEHPIDPATGEPIPLPPIIPTNSFDNDELHIEVHNKYRKSQSYEILSEEAKAAFESHVGEHENKVREKLMQQMQMEQQLGVEPGTSQAGGDPSQEGPPPGPEPMPEMQM